MEQAAPRRGHGGVAGIILPPPPPPGHPHGHPPTHSPWLAPRPPPSHRAWTGTRIGDPESPAVASRSTGSGAGAVTIAGGGGGGGAGRPGGGRVANWPHRPQPLHRPPRRRGTASRGRGRCDGRRLDSPPPPARRSSPPLLPGVPHSVGGCFALARHPSPARPVLHPPSFVAGPATRPPSRSPTHPSANPPAPLTLLLTLSPHLTNFGRIFPPLLSPTTSSWSRRWPRPLCRCHLHARPPPHSPPSARWTG